MCALSAGGTKDGSADTLNMIIGSGVNQIPLNLGLGSAAFTGIKLIRPPGLFRSPTTGCNEVCWMASAWVVHTSVQDGMRRQAKD